MNLSGFAAVGLGAACGAWLRWLLSHSLNHLLPGLPLGTLIANLTGGYLIGLAMGLFALNPAISLEPRLLITTGFLGGLTTFSTFSAEAIGLFLRQEYGWAVAHILGHLLGSLLMTALGLWTVQMLRN